MKTLISWIRLSLLFIAMSAPTQAEDIDLFAGITPGGANPPTVLLGWHSTANSNANVTHGCVYGDSGAAPSLGDTVGGMEQCALVNTMLSLLDAENDYLLGAIKIGLMVFNENGYSSFNNGTGLGNGDNRCGYLLVPPTLMDSSGINSFISKLKSIDKNNLANQSRLGDLIAESWAMLNGLATSCSGVDYSGLAETATQCRDAVLVYIGNATKENSSVADGTGSPDTLLKNQLTSEFSYSTGSSQYKFFATPRAVTQLTNSDSSNNKYWGDEWAQFMNLVDTSDSAQSDRNVSTYSIAVYDPSLETKLAGEINFLADLANVGGGKAFKVTADNHAGLAEVLLQIFNEVQDINSAFSSATLPVSANTQGTFLNQVYIASFRPDSDAAPRWNGNVKQYQLGFDAGGNIVLTDSTQDVASVVTSVTNPITGAIVDDAVSFWTTNTPKDASGAAVADWPLDGFWRNSPEGEGFAFDHPDGDLVEKGGAGQLLRVNNLTTSSGRKVYTCNSVGNCPSASALPEFKTTNTALVSQLDAELGAAEEGGNASISVGRYDDGETISTSCSGKGNNITCTITHDGSGGTQLDAATDRVVILNAWNESLQANKQSCTFAAPCSISNVTATSFDVASRNIPDGQTYNGAVIVEVSRAARVAQTSHGLSLGDQVELEGCTVGSTANTHNSALLNGTVLGSVIAVTDADNYLLRLGDYVLAENNNVSCGSSAVSLTAETLIDWVRGEDIIGNESRRGPCPPELRGSDCPITARGSIHADVLHSRPAVINYGGTTGVVVFYGSNDGHFHAINGNQAGNIAGVQPGGELWSFIAPEFFGKFKRQFNNDPLVKYPNVLDSRAQPRDYFFDGNTTILQDKRTGKPTSGKSLIFMSARRGGRLLYALDVSNVAEPRYLWSLTNDQVPELGQTWSQAQLTLIKGHSNPVLILGAGYDPAEDQEPAPATNSQGRGILILDAMTGGVLWAALADCTGVTVATGGHCETVSAMTKSFPADVTVLDKDLDGFTDRLYAADVGGNIWRVDLEAASPATTAFSDIEVNKFASLGGSGNSARKFLFAPDVVPTNNFDAVVAVSGDREHPLYTSSTTAGLAYNVENKFFMIMDKNTGKSMPSTHSAVTVSDLVDQSTLQCTDGSGGIVSCGSEGATELYFSGLDSGVAGYYFDLLVGEKGVNAPLAVAGKVYFGTNQPDVPDAESCSANLGNAGAYVVNLVTGERQRNEFSGGGLPPSPIAGLVTIDGKTVPFVIGGAGPSPFDPSTPALDLSGGRKRTYWYYE
ncbi:pilus assembly protein [Spongiibacter marinus]|jgi:Tfp pilus tip-associated adhesin PilY1|uniref:pilus assembly protein n=1 Tax=Spongiibacter marinus TaxID=354246 RepID=UPI003C4683B9